MDFIDPRTLTPNIDLDDDDCPVQVVRFIPAPPDDDYDW